MYVETYAYPYERQVVAAAFHDEAGPAHRDDDESQVEEAVHRYDAAGRVPYEDLC